MQQPVSPFAHGFSILELLLVLIVIAAIVFTGINRYQLYQREREVAIIRENISLLYQALNSYYQKTCQELLKPPAENITLDDLNGVYPIKSRLMSLPGVDYSAGSKIAFTTTSTIKNTVYWLTVKIYFDNRWSAAKITWYTTALGAVKATNSDRPGTAELYLQRLPGRNFLGSKGDANLGAMSTGLLYFSHFNEQGVYRSAPVCGYY